MFGSQTNDASDPQDRPGPSDAPGTSSVVEELENRLRISEEQSHARLAELQSIYATAPVGLCVLTPELRYIRINDRLAEINGVPAQEHIGRTVREIVPHLADAAELLFFNVIETGQPFLDHVFEGETAAQPGMKRIWRESCFPLKDREGRVSGIHVVAEEITDRTRAEEALRESENRLRLAVDTAEMGIWDWHLDTNTIYWDDTHLALFGRAPGTGELSYETFLQYVHPTDRERLAEAITRAVSEHIELHHEFRIVRDGEVRWMHAHGKLLCSESGNLIRMLGAVYDITKHKRTENELKRTNRLKDDFIATLAHELRNPLAPIRNAAEMLRGHNLDHPDFAWARNVIDEQVTHLSRLIDDLLDVSRITRNKLALKKERIALADIIHVVLDTTRSIISERGHELTVDMPKEPVFLFADAVRVIQMFVNLLNNAAKFTPRGGRIAMHVARHGASIVARVTDNGIGISEEQLPRLFDKYFQADRSYQQAMGGVGIGLTLVKQLVEMHGGTVEARSAGIDKGSEFIVTLPIFVEPAQLAITMSGPEPISALPRRILVVDDYPNAAESLARWLRRLGNEVQIALDGMEAIQTAERFVPDIVLLDIGMPKLNGYETAQRIRQQPWGKRIGLVALTGWGQEEDRRRTREAGFDAHMTKPVSHAALASLLARLESKATC